MTDPSHEIPWERLDNLYADQRPFTPEELLDSGDPTATIIRQASNIAWEKAITEAYQAIRAHVKAIEAQLAVLGKPPLAQLAARFAAIDAMTDEDLNEDLNKVGFAPFRPGFDMNTDRR